MSPAACLLGLFASFCIIGLIMCQSEQLILTQIVYRHGDRAPYDTYPTNPVPPSVWPEGFQQLTQIGMKQHYELGKYFRSRYMLGHPYTLLNESYAHDEIQVQSTDIDRTLMSAYSNLAGMYPPDGYQVWSPDVKWQPIPVHTRPLPSDHILNVELACPRYDQYMADVLRSEEVQRVEKENADFYAYISRAIGVQEQNITVIWKIFDTLLCQKRHGYSLPEWAQKNWTSGQTVYERLHALVNFDFDISFNRAGEWRLRGGPLLGELTSNMLDKVEGRSGPAVNKSFIYSAHDDTVTAVTSAMGVFNGIAPPYATALLVELVNLGGVNVVRLLYKNESTHEPYTLQVPGCLVNCPLEEFVRLTKHNVPQNWHKECRAAWAVAGVIGMIYWFLIILAMVGLFYLLYATSYLVYRRRAERRKQMGGGPGNRNWTMGGYEAVSSNEGKLLIN